MSSVKLAEKMLEWRNRKKELDTLEEEIKHEVMLEEESVTIGDIVARFNSGKRSFNYEIVGKTASEVIVKQHTKLEEKVDWKAVCADANIVNIPFETGNPSVTLSIKEVKDVKPITQSFDVLPF